MGVVSNVAIFSLKAKVGKLETEAEKRNNKIQQLEKEKSTLTLLNTEARYLFCFLFVCNFWFPFCGHLLFLLLF